MLGRGRITALYLTRLVQSLLSQCFNGRREAPRTELSQLNGGSACRLLPLAWGM